MGFTVLSLRREDTDDVHQAKYAGEYVSLLDGLLRLLTGLM